MENLDRVYDGTNIIISDEKKIPMEQVNKITIVLHAYWLFHVVTINENERERSLMKVIYPCTEGKEKFSNEALLAGQTRKTMSIHYLNDEKQTIERMLDLKNPTSVDLTGHRDIIIETYDGQKETVSFDGNAMNRLPNANYLHHEGKTEPLIDFYDRASDILKLAKQQGVKVVSSI